MQAQLPEEEATLLLESKNKAKFLLDENVIVELLNFLKSKKYDVITASKGFTNGKLAAMSIHEKRILVTNDRHFTNHSLFQKEKIFSLVWLRIPQGEPEKLLTAFSRLLQKISYEEFEGNMITLSENEIEIEEILD